MTPSYTIILPVHNGMANGYLPACVASILAQTYPDFELAVLENASTDGSAEWLAQQTDSRIHIYPALRHLSFEENWARPTTIPRAEWMTFIGHDDLLDPIYLSMVDRAIRSDPEIDMVNNRFRRIDSKGNTIATHPVRAAIESGIDYVRGWFLEDRECFCGTMMRTSQFDAIGGFPSFVGGLYADWAASILIGYHARKIANLPDELFFVRSDPKSSSKTFSAQNMTKPLKQFYAFLDKCASQDPMFRCLVAEAAANGSFMRHSRGCYNHILYTETRRNRTVTPAVRQEIASGLDIISPGCSVNLSDVVSVRRQEFINSRLECRVAYRIYDSLRAMTANLRNAIKN